MTAHKKAQPGSPVSTRLGNSTYQNGATPVSQIRVPASIDTAVHKLTSVDSLVTAKEWERAAIVAAFTRKGGQGAYQQEQKTNNRLLTTGEFAALGIQGLRTRDTVRRYRDAWLTTGRSSAPGEVVDLDDLGTFPPVPELIDPVRVAAFDDAADAEGAASIQVQKVATHLPAMRAAIKADPRVAAAAMQALDERHDEAPKPIVRDRSKSQRFLDAVTSSRAASRKLKDFADAVAGGEWGPDEAAAFELQVNQLSAALDMIRAGLNSGSWDAELETLLAGGAS